MSLQEINFHTAVAGFNRSEVLTYIRTLTQQQETELQTLSARHEQALQSLQEQHELDLDALRSQLDEARAEAEAATPAEETRQELATLRSEGDTLRQENDALREEIVALKAQLAAWAPNVSSYDILRAQLGEIELDARTRSATMLNLAHQQELALYRQADATLRQAEQSFRQARNNADATLAHLISELQRLQADLTALGTPLDQHLAVLSALHIQYPNHEEAAADE